MNEFIAGIPTVALMALFCTGVFYVRLCLELAGITIESFGAHEWQIRKEAPSFAFWASISFLAGVQFIVLSVGWLTERGETALLIYLAAPSLIAFISSFLLTWAYRQVEPKQNKQKEWWVRMAKRTGWSTLLPSMLGIATLMICVYFKLFI